MQFRGHSLPVYQPMSVPWEFLPRPILLAKSTYAISPHKCHRNVSLPSDASLWNGKFGRVEGQNTTVIFGSFVSFKPSHWPIEYSVRSGRPGFNPRTSHTKESKMVFDAALFSTQHYKVMIKGKVEQSREWSHHHHHIVLAARSALLYTSV